jgi:hypothetical protein
MQVCGDIMGLRSWEFTQGPLSGHHAQLSISFNGICIFIYGKLNPIYFFRFYIFDRLILEEYVSQVERGPYLF